MLDGISVMVAAADWLGDETDATLDEPANTPEGCADGGGDPVWPWGVSVVSLPTPVPNVKSLENEVDRVGEFVVFIVRGLCEALPAVEDDAVTKDSSEVTDEGRATDGKDVAEGFVVAVDSMDAAPAPLPAAGTEPTCLVVAAMEGPLSVGEDKACVSDGFEAVDEGRATDGEGCLNDVVVALDSMEAAPAPLPTAGTEPTCFDGRMLETEAACARGRDFVSTEGVDVARVEVAVVKVSVVESECCPTGTAGMED